MTMNRAMRRFMAKNKPATQEKVVPLPALLDEFTIFDTPQRILTKLGNGEIEAVRGVPVFTDNTGELCEVCPAMNGWLYTWQRIDEKLALNLNLDPLIKVINKLNAAMYLTHKDVFNAKAALDSIRVAFRRSDRKAIMQIAKDAQIAILMDPNALPKQRSIA